jgi:hypothetical protein
MANKYRKPPPDLIRTSIDLQKRVAILETNPRAVSTAINSGHFQFIASNGVVMVDFGDFGPGVGPGFIFRRGISGKEAFGLGGDQVSGDQYWHLNDISGNDIFTDDVESGQGIGRPYLAMHPTLASQVNSTPAAQTSSTTFIPAYYVRGYKQQPQVQVEYIITTPAGGTAEVQLVDTSFGAGSPIMAGPNVHPASTFQFFTLRGPITGAHESICSIELQYRLASGTGPIGLTCMYVNGHQS